jgi:tetratricopeptide (TPR) repeat protein
VREGTRWLDVALAASAGRPAALRAPVLHGVNVFAGLRGDRRREQETAAEALELYRELDDTRGTAVMLRASGAAASRDGDFGAAAAFYEESATLFRELDDRTALAIVITNLGDLALKEGDAARAWELCTESLALQRGLGSTFGAVLSLCNLGYAALHEGRVDDARAALQEGLLLAHDYGAHDMVGVALEGLAAVAAGNAEWEVTGRLLGSAEAIRAATGTELETAESLVHERTIAFLRDSATAGEIDAWRGAGWTSSEEEAVALGLDVRAPAVR